MARKKAQEVDPNAEIDAILAQGNPADDGEMLPPTEKIGDLMEQYKALLDIKDELARQTKDNDAALEGVQYKLLQRMDEADVDKVSNKFITLTKKTEVYPTILDKHELLEFVHEHAEDGMVIVRVNDKSFREYLQATGSYPEGTDGFMKTKLNHRRNKK